ncbi:MAG: hypothetical protein LQ347_001450 [Umbilicaria vellea]|nr:MAG: hypothetical protein LQ347_001450 [Umbilicaria vellea]
MSSDLWKEFGSASQDPSENPWTQTASCNGGFSIQDDMGYASTTSTRTKQSITESFGVGLRSESGLKEVLPPATASPLDGGADVWGDLRSLGSPTLPAASREGGRPYEANSVEVLFDATHELSVQDNDDFGDFEDPNSQLSEDAVRLPLRAPIQSPFSMNPVSNLQNPGQGLAASPYPQAPKSPSFQDRNPFSDLAVSTNPARDPAEKDASPITAWPSYVRPKAAPYLDSPMDFLDEESDWGDFIDASALGPVSANTARHCSTSETQANEYQSPTKTLPSIPGLQTREPGISTVSHTSLVMSDDIILKSTNGRLQKRAAVSAPQPAGKAQPTYLAAMQAPMQSGTVPPSNIPPPSILLTLFPSLFLSLPNEIKSLFLDSTDSSKSRSYIDHARKSGMKVCLSVTTVAARIIGGRSLRWKRDTHLSQSMRVGPAHAGKVGGMKLAGLDKTEMLRENREVLEVVRVWRQQVGKVRSAVTSANSQLGGSAFKVPALSENPPVRTAKPDDGAINALNSCVLCGLKREERLDKINIDVEDSFGEWWTDHWGHAECRLFWEEHRASLLNR